MFNYARAFSRNLGWVTESEQQQLRQATVAIAGMGGVGGSHLLTLTRLGVGGFHLADFDQFEQENFNRQAGANLHTVGQPKLDSLVEMALSINPELRINRFSDGLTEHNLSAFLDGVDCYLDGLDFFALPIRRATFNQCAARKIPAVTAAPLGMSSALLCFLPGKMGFDDYFGTAAAVSEDERYLRFYLGLAPAALHRHALVEPTRINIKARKGPSTAMGCELCAGLAATQVLKLLLRRTPPLAAPWSLQFDAYSGRLARCWRPGGYRHPLQRLALAIGKRQLGID